ncbi:MAG: thioredoxin domain-containing protein [Pseudomonadota bacterium]
MTPIVSALLVIAAHAAPPACEALEGAERERAEALLARTWPHACCDDTLSACLAATPRCRLVDRLATDLCQRVAKSQPDETIALALRQRAWSRIAFGPPARIALATAPTAGDPAAPVVLVVYASPLGPNCARMLPPLYAAITAGALAGKVQLFLKPFPLRSTPHDTEAGLVLMAAHEHGAFWDLALWTWAHAGDFRLEALQEEAEAAGIAARTEDPALLDVLRASKREGVELGVTSTPTFYLDGRLYRGELEVEELVDTLEEAWEAATGLIYTEDGP